VPNGAICYYVPNGAILLVTCYYVPIGAILLVTAKWGDLFLGAKWGEYASWSVKSKCQIGRYPDHGLVASHALTNQLYES
jgi:hypothetical protein